MKNISVTIITLNEEKNIKRAVESAKLLSKEIIVVDSGSVDRTVYIAMKSGAKVFERKFDNFASQKNFAASKALGEWIFSLDADEMIPNLLAQEIKKEIHDPQFDAYSIPRRNFILGAEIKHSRWSPDEHIWLWKKEKGRWVGEVHEEVHVEGRIGKLKFAKTHYQDEDISEFITSMNQYTQFEAEKLSTDNVKFSYFKLIYYPFKSFVGRYFYKQGYKDGWRGFVLCSLRSIYHAIVWLKLLELEKR